MLRTECPIFATWDWMWVTNKLEIYLIQFWYWVIYFLLITHSRTICHMELCNWVKALTSKFLDANVEEHITSHYYKADVAVWADDNHAYHIWENSLPKFWNLKLTFNYPPPNKWVLSTWKSVKCSYFKIVNLSVYLIYF